MDEIKLPVNQCPLCNLKNVQSLPYKGHDLASLYHCPNCGSFSISYMAYRFTPIINDSETRSKLSYFIKHNTSEEKPIYIQQGNYTEILKSVYIPTTLEKIDNLLLWFGENSKYSFSTVDGRTSYLRAILGCSNQTEVIELLDQLWVDKYIEMEVPTTGPLRERAVFDPFCGHLTKLGIQRIEEIKRNNSPLNFNLTDLTAESILKQKESSQIEVKGSCKLNLDRLLKIEGKIYFDDKIALNGFLKEVVAFLNTKGGSVIIGVVETSKYTSEQINKIPYSQYGDYYIIGIKLENEDVDTYQRMLHDLISTHISKELVELIEITFPELSGFPLCKIDVNKASHKWYYLDKDKFYVRIGNKTEILSGEDADSYKSRNRR